MSTVTKRATKTFQPFGAVKIKTRKKRALARRVKSHSRANTHIYLRIYADDDKPVRKPCPSIGTTRKKMVARRENNPLERERVEMERVRAERVTHWPAHRVYNGFLRYTRICSESLTVGAIFFDFFLFNSRARRCPNRSRVRFRFAVSPGV